MEARMVTEEEMALFKGEIPQDIVVTYIKLINVGPETLKAVNGNVSELKEKCAEQSGFFLITKREEMQDNLTSLIDRFSEKIKGA